MLDQDVGHGETQNSTDGCSAVGNDKQHNVPEERETDSAQRISMSYRRYIVYKTKAVCCTFILYPHIVLYCC